MLRLGRTRTGRQLLLHQSVLVQLGQHAVESGKQPPDFVSAVPLGTLGVVGGQAHLFGHLGQAAQGARNLCGHQVHHAQNGGQQQQRRAQVHGHAGVQVVHAVIQQPAQGGQPLCPGKV